MKKFFDSILNVSVPDPDDARRRRLLNILLLGNTIAALLALLAIIVASLIVQQSNESDVQILLVGIIVITLGIMGIYQINRRVSGRWAA